MKIFERIVVIVAQLQVSNLTRLLRLVSNNNNIGIVERRTRQSNCHHYAAYWLDPANNGNALKITVEDTSQVWRALKLISVNEAEYLQMKTQWQYFLAKMGPFAAGGDCWKMKTMEEFWMDVLVFSIPLARYAIRLAQTVANTTISERGFSSLNRVQTRLRSSLNEDRLDKLIFINMNATLAETIGQDRASAKRRRLNHTVLTDAEKEQMKKDREEAMDELHNIINEAVDSKDSGQDALAEGIRRTYISIADICI